MTIVVVGAVLGRRVDPPRHPLVEFGREVLFLPLGGVTTTPPTTTPPPNLNSTTPTIRGGFLAVTRAVRDDAVVPYPNNHQTTPRPQT